MKADKEKQSGFTLIEIMVGLSILVVAMGLLFGGLRLGNRAWDKAEKNTAEQNAYMTTYRLANNWLGRLYPAITMGRLEPEYAFYGDDRQVRFTAFMPPYPTLGGLYIVELSIENIRDEQDQDIQALVLRRRAFDAEADFELAFSEDFDPEEQHILLEIAEGQMAFEYFTRAEVDYDDYWTSDVDLEEGFPNLIRLKFSSAGDGFDNRASQWPDMVFAVYVNMDGACILEEIPEDRLCRLIDR